MAPLLLIADIVAGKGVINDMGLKSILIAYGVMMVLGLWFGPALFSWMDPVPYLVTYFLLPSVCSVIHFMMIKKARFFKTSMLAGKIIFTHLMVAAVQIFIHGMFTIPLIVFTLISLLPPLIYSLIRFPRMQYSDSTTAELHELFDKYFKQ